MQLKVKDKAQVVVVGSGLAGIVSAVTASENNADVILLCNGSLFSGSSFSKGTWGLGLIAPENYDDENDLIDTIMCVGCGMADNETVTEFVKNITPSVEWIKKLGVRLKSTDNPTQKDFIPCFDHKHRSWNGLIGESVREVFAEKIKQLGIKVIENTFAFDIVCEDNEVRGVVIADSKFTNAEIIECSSLVIASGGLTTLYKHHITSVDVSACMHYPAYKNGAGLVNLEFMQIMPGYVKPCYGTIFNEKVFRYVNMTSPSGKDLINHCRLSAETLDIRSAHGPFTVELPSKYVDFIISKYKTSDGVKITYKDELKNNMSEFAVTYFSWLKENKNLSPDDEIYIKMFAHASNGGIKTDKNAFTGINGLYACGEVAGGMHGADRLGGLSTANGLVFGIKAGKNASEYAKSHKTISAVYDLSMTAFSDVSKREDVLAETMYRYAMVVRNAEGLQTAMSQLLEIHNADDLNISENMTDVIRSHIFYSRVQTAMLILEASLNRNESRGSHYREDFPYKDIKLARSVVYKKV